MRHVAIVAVIFSLTACGSPSPSAPPPAGGAMVEIGPPTTGAGSPSVDIGEARPADPSKFHKQAGYSPYAGRRYPERAYFGDQHLHTSWSVDAGGTGTTVGPEEALRFARGEEIVSTSGQPVKLAQPLDWVVITDHSDGMGVISEI